MIRPQTPEDIDQDDPRFIPGWHCYGGVHYGTCTRCQRDYWAVYDRNRMVARWPVEVYLETAGGAEDE